jgi:hypothetical protein
MNRSIIQTENDANATPRAGITMLMPALYPAWRGGGKIGFDR